MAPNRSVFTKLVLTDTSSTSLVVGGATAVATTGTGGIIAGNAALSQAAAPLIAPLTLRGGGSAGAYTLVNSGVVFKNGAGVEVWRLWATDPDSSNFNSQNLYVGLAAGNAQPTDNVDAGYSNVGIGANALLVIAQGFNNVAVGTGTLSLCTDGADNTAVGQQAAASLTVGEFNVLVGSKAGEAITAGSGNTLIGTESAKVMFDGEYNTAVGIYSLFDLAHGDFNVAVGYGALENVTGASNSDQNVAVGDDAGAAFAAVPSPLLLSNQCVFLGAQSRALINASVNEIVIGYSAVGHGSNTATIGLGTASPNCTHLYAPATIVAKVDASNFASMAVSAAGAVTFDATGASAGFSFSDALTMAAPLLMTGVITPTQLAANTDNWNPTGLATANVIRVSTDAARDLTGLVAQTSGRIILLYNAGAFDISMPHDATSTAANRWFCPNNATYTLSSHETTQLRYDGTDSRWTVMGSV